MDSHRLTARPTSASPTTPSSNSVTSCSSNCPKVGQVLAQGEVFGTIESVKAVSELFSPVAGEVVAVNDALTSAPEQVNSDPHGAWIIRVRPDQRRRTRRPARRGGLRAARRLMATVTHLPTATSAPAPRTATACCTPSACRRSTRSSIRWCRRTSGAPSRSCSLPAETEAAFLARLRTLAVEERTLPVVHRHGLLRHAHAGRHPAHGAGESGLVHALHALPGRDRAGPPRGPAERSRRWSAT